MFQIQGIHCNFLIFYRVKLKFFARDSESGNDLDSNVVIGMINSGKVEGLEDHGFKVESASASEYCTIEQRQQEYQRAHDPRHSAFTLSISQCNNCPERVLPPTRKPV